MSTGPTGPIYPGQGIMITESWRVVDQWWRDDPVNRFFVVLVAPDGVKVCVSYDMRTAKWELFEDPE